MHRHSRRLVSNTSHLGGAGFIFLQDTGRKLQLITTEFLLRADYFTSMSQWGYHAKKVEMVIFHNLLLALVLSVAFQEM